MLARRAARVGLAVALAAALARASAAAAAMPPADPDPLRPLLGQLEDAFRTGEPAAYLDLLTGSASGERARAFMADDLRPGATRVVIAERARETFHDTPPDTAYRLVLDAFLEYGHRARVSTWSMDVRLGVDGRWRIEDEARLSSVENIVRLSLDGTTEYDARGFHLTAEDLDLVLEDGRVFTLETAQGTTGFILLGRGAMRFRPAPEGERQQIKVLTGADALVSRFDAAYVRVGSLYGPIDRSRLTPRPVDARDLQRAERIFREESPKSFVLDLADLTRDNWSLLPGANDFLAEVRTRDFETLTYARSESDPEDISLFDRRRHKNLSVYASAAKLASRGPFYSDDDRAPYDVVDYDLDTAFTPDRLWLEGRARLRLRWRSGTTAQIPLRLADSLVVQSVVSDRFGRLFTLRVKNQNLAVVHLPVVPEAGDEIALTIAYAGRLEPQTPDRETTALAQPRARGLPPPLPEGVPLPRLERSFLYSNRSYWHPQGAVAGFATATIRVTVPSAWDCVASGAAADGSPTTIGDPPDRRKVFRFRAAAPARYFALLVSRFVNVDRLEVTFDAPVKNWEPRAPRPAGLPAALRLSVATNPQHVQRGRPLLEKAADIARFYDAVLGDVPYPDISVALVENPLPGGHSPPYMVLINQPPLVSSLNWRGDPSAFEDFPDFFLAHEMAHQWWGQAVGWQNYHEQWLSEGFAQYFAALYARQSRGQDLFASVMRQMRQSSLDASDQGPVYLGYRLGHVQGDSRTFRALVYNKGAVVLHMLRQLVGDDAFFRGLRRFYAESRFRKTGTDAFRQAMEAESGQRLGRFFERWIFGSTRPRLRWSSRLDTGAVMVRVEQQGEVFDVPLTLTLHEASGRSTEVVVPLHEAVTEVRIPVAHPPGSLDVSRQDLSLAEIARGPWGP